MASSSMKERQADVLDRLERDCNLHPKALAYMAGVGDRQARRWFAGSHLMSLDALNRILSGPGLDPAVGDALVSFALERTPYLAVDLDPAAPGEGGEGGEADGNAVGLMAASLRKSAHALENAIDRSADGVLDSRDAGELIPQLDATIRLLMQARHQVAASGRRHPRKNARNARNASDTPDLHLSGDAS